MAVVSTAAAGQAAAGRGASMVLLRAPGASGRALEGEALALVATTRLPVLVGSRADVALAAGAAGVNLPEMDIPVLEARRLLGPGALVGRSVHSLGAALTAAVQGADLILYGPIFETPSHPGTPGLGLKALERMVAAVPIPVVAIGGIDAAREAECLATGAAGIAAVRMFQ